MLTTRHTITKSVMQPLRHTSTFKTYNHLEYNHLNRLTVNHSNIQPLRHTTTEAYNHSAMQTTRHTNTDTYSLYSKAKMLRQKRKLSYLINEAQSGNLRIVLVLGILGLSFIMD